MPPFSACYGWCKVRLDPVYSLVLAELDDAKRIVDLGSGIGLMEVLLAQRGSDVQVRAVEWDERKVRTAREATAGFPGIVIEQGDLREAELGRPDAVVLLDVLHYLPLEVQREVLSRCAVALAPGGRLLVRELDPPTGRGSLSVGLERLAVALGWNRATEVRPWPVRDMADYLARLGFSVRVVSAGRGLFASNAFLAAQSLSR